MNFKDVPPGMLLNEDWFSEEEVAEARRQRLEPYTLGNFLALQIKPREMLLAPILPEKGLAMMYAVRGTGKTLVALGMAYAIATGTAFLKWQAPQPRRVLLIDGEMPAAEMQKRLANCGWCIV